MAELKRRRTKTAKTSAGNARDTRTNRPEQQNHKESPQWARLLVAIGALLYLPALAVVNPITVLRFYRNLVRRPCSGTCDVAGGGGDDVCGPVDADRIIFLRIPKTAGTTVRSLFATLGASKAVAVHNLGELEDLTSSLPRPGVPIDAQAYHDPDPRSFRRRLQHYYRRASAMVIAPPYLAQDRNFFHGHLYHFDWSTDALKMAGPEPAWARAMPRFLVRWYGVERPTAGEMAGAREIALVRRPLDRLASMYYYDRHGARTDRWRREFAEQRGNMTLEECLSDGGCVEINELRRWCSVQVELLCGLGKECARPVGRAALERAKENVREKILFTGVVERLDESLEFLERLLLTYLEGLGEMESIPREKQTNVARRERTFSPSAQKVLNDICALDNELYRYVDNLLTERIGKCKEKAA